MGEEHDDLVQKVKKEERETTEEGKVIIKMGAFRNMLTHVLRFGNEALDDSVEVMGICMGKSGSKDELIIENAIPITHGSRIEVGFAPEDYAAFAEIDEQYADKGLYAIGWYHSHPGWGLFFSDSDIKNHLFYQKKQTPHAFGIVFDHTLMGKEGNLGFEIYRLKDFKKGPSSDYLKVAYEIEVPKTLDYFKWVQKFVEDSQKKAPILIKEINEFSEPIQGELQEIPGAEELVEETEEQKQDKYPEITPIISGFTQGADHFKEQFLNFLKPQLGNWVKDVSNGTLKGAEFMRNTLNQMKEAISFGMNKVQNWFEKNLGEVMETFRTDILEYLNTRMAAQKQLASEMPEKKEEISIEITKLIQDSLKANISQMEEKVNITDQKLNETSEACVKLEELINDNSKNISNIAGGINKISQDVGKGIEDLITPLEETTGNEIEKLSSELNTVKETYAKMKEMFDKLQKSIMELRNL